MIQLFPILTSQPSVDAVNSSGPQVEVTLSLLPSGGLNMTVAEGVRGSLGWICGLVL